MKKLFWFILVMFLVMQGLDVLLTWILSQQYSLMAVEANPLMRSVAVPYGWTGVLAIKAGVALGSVFFCIGAFFAFADKRLRNVQYWILSILVLLVLVQGAVDVRNYLVLIQGP